MEKTGAVSPTLAVWVNRSKSSGRTPASLGFSAFLYSHRRKSWVLIELLLSSVLFLVGMQHSPYLRGATIQPSTIVCAVVYGIAFCSFGLGIGFYERKRRFSLWYGVAAGLLTSTAAVLCALATVYILFYITIGRLTLVFGAIAGYLGIAAFRVSAIGFLKSSSFKFTAIGHSPLTDSFREFFSTRKRNYGYYEFVEWAGTDYPPENPTRFAEYLESQGIADIVLANTALDDPRLMEFATTAMQFGCRVIDETSFYGQVFERVPVETVNRYWVLSRALNSRRVFTFACKRSGDVILASVGLVFAAPLMALIALAIKIESRGPAFFIQPRLGAFCRPFKMIKFRTMRVDGALGIDRSEEGFTQTGDSRITHVGRIIRPLHLDELPQLWNILAGEMSLIGPRPEALHFATKMREAIPLYDLRYLVRPGLSGLAQISMGYAMDNVADTKRKLSYDLHYICNFSLLTDIRIIIQTFFVLARRAR